MSRVTRAAIALACCTLLPIGAHAVEANAAVKVQPLLKTTTTWDGAAIAYPQGQPEVTGMLIELAPGGETGWHDHSVPSFAMILEGTLEVTLKDGRVQRAKAGDAFAEVVNTPHNGRNVGDTPVKIIVFYAGVTGAPLTTARPQ